MNILVVAPHPDDETLGCGGTLLKHKALGDATHWLICTDMDPSDGYAQELIAAREREIAAVAALYDFDSISRLRLPTARVDTYSMKDVMSKISGIITGVQPSIVYLPFKGDPHSDHRRIFSAVYACTKSFRYPYIRKLMMMETLSETEFAPCVGGPGFAPNSFSDITPYFDRKTEILSLYQGETGRHPFPRSIENVKALATLRGATANVAYAEAFMMVKEIW